ncbi:deoxyribose-phosphate aldolase [Candidatus Parcubacteria bacterium]|nr:deoxyribose-phosphate aldolase [Patescibacteria group bacterium]MBU4466809.1 deoxyribose-phosphate aldolase [Patescibacteria group bacterium]MCG2688224.1 deoxyribose-phosphate aldolase [Candidatus Parcubacteria bacterium]
MATEKEIVKIIDHTNIKKEADQADIAKSCQEAKEFGFRGLCLNPQWIKLAKQELTGTGVKIICLIDPPMGISPHELRIQKCQKAKLDGADEIDVVMNIIDMKYGRYLNILGDLKEICQILPTKVIIGSGYLTNNEVEKASQLVKEAGAICVKTATEKDPLGHSELIEKANHLKIMRGAAPGLLIKAAGGIKSLEDLEMMTAAGADIIGTSYGVEIARQAKARE